MSEVILRIFHMLVKQTMNTPYNNMFTPIKIPLVC